MVYDLLFKASAEAVLTIAADPRHLGARIGITSVLHSWGSAMTHHPHVHMIVPGGGLPTDGSRWIACRPRFFLSVRMLSRLFRRLFLDALVAAHARGQFAFYGQQEGLAEARAFVKRQRRTDWVVYSMAPFGGHEAVLAYLARYTHRVAIANRRLIAAGTEGVTFTYKDYRVDGPGRFKTMTLATHEFIRRFLMHVLPKGFQRIRHYGLLANGNRAAAIAKARDLLGVEPRDNKPASKQAAEPATEPQPLPCCCPRCSNCELLLICRDLVCEMTVPAMQGETGALLLRPAMA